MIRKSNIERRLNDLEDDSDPDLATMTDEEVAEAYQTAVDPERPSPVDATKAYIESLGRKYENESENDREGDS